MNGKGNGTEGYRCDQCTVCAGMKNMNRRSLSFIILILFCLCAVCACAENETGDNTTGELSSELVSESDSESPNTNDVYIHSISELNVSEHTEDSHAGLYRYSTLEQDNRTYTTLEGIRINGIDAYYPRLKKLSDGAYLLFFQNGRYGGKVYCCYGDDIGNFRSPIELFGSEKLDGETKLYMTCDAEQLPDGTVLAVCSYRSTSDYANAIGKNGIVARSSTDGGKTWSEQRTAYVGTNWEPSLLVSGEHEVKLLFTSTAPTIELYGFEERSGSTAMVVSNDNGQTWTPNVTSSPWIAQIIAQRYLGTDGNIIRTTDQMPVAVVLNNKRTALALEEEINGSFYLGFAYSDNAFSDVSLAVGENGPANVK